MLKYPWTQNSVEGKERPSSLDRARLESPYLVTAGPDSSSGSYHTLLQVELILPKVSLYAPENISR